MISGLVQLLFFQGAGELVSKFLLPTLPGPVVGLVLLLLFLVWRREVNEPLGSVADTFGRYLGLLFVPAAVGVALYLPLLKANALALIVAIVSSVCLTIASSALVLHWTHRRRDP
jgi:holin-like protein